MEASVARVGGDDFMAVIPSDGIAAFQDGRLTIPGASVGVAHYPVDGDTLDAVIAAADRHLYQRKRCPYPPNARYTDRAVAAA